jgi:DNA-binding MarR family transcriptional regulator
LTTPLRPLGLFDRQRIILTRRDLSLHTKLLWLRLVELDQAITPIRVKAPWLARTAGLTTRTLFRALNELEEAGLIDRSASVVGRRGGLELRVIHQRSVIRERRT